MAIQIDRSFYQLWLKMKAALEDAPEEDPAFIVAKLTAEEVKEATFALEQLEIFYFAASRLEKDLEERRRG